MINWYPGHMAKAKRKLKEDLSMVDLVVEVLDARIPFSSRNKDLDELLNQQKRVIVLNKNDLALEKQTKKWIDYFSKDYPTVALNSKKGIGISSLEEKINNLHYKIEKKAENKGRKNKDIKVMIIGIPNVGKSALINSLSGKKQVKTGDKPGVTRGKQWIKLNKNIRLLDTPGILWPNLDDDEISYKLAITAAIDSDRYDKETAAYRLIKYILDMNSSILEDNYKVETLGIHPYDILLEIAKKRGCLMSGGRIDKERVSKIILNDFRSGKLGRLTLERVENIKNKVEREE